MNRLTLIVLGISLLGIYLWLRPAYVEVSGTKIISTRFGNLFIDSWELVRRKP